MDRKNAATNCSTPSSPTGPSAGKTSALVCAYCGEEILPGESADNQGADLHRECLFRGVAGSVGHQLKKCSCYGGTEGDPPGMTPRQAAQAALNLYRALHPEESRKHPKTEI